LRVVAICGRGRSICRGWQAWFCKPAHACQCSRRAL